MAEFIQPTVWIIGGPGSGKGYLCRLLVAKYGFTHISIGDLLRKEVSTGSKRGQQLAEIMKEGALVSTSVVMNLLNEEIKSKLATSKGFLIDGYPRKKNQGEEFETAIKPVDMVLCLECTDETMARSVLRRAETDGRSDDNLETFRKRLRTFHANNAAIVEAYKSKAVSVSVERNPEVVFAEVQKHFDTLVSCSVSTRT